MARSALLWDANLDRAEACLQHPFVQGIAGGTLPRARFAFYVGQDAFFLDAFARAYAVAFAKAPDRASMAAFRELLDGVFRELELHRAYAARWQVELTNAAAAATRAYADFVLRVAWSEPAGHAAAAMTPCMRLYAYLGQALHGRANPDSPYAEWVETYGAPDFEGLARRLEGLLDRLDDGSDAVADHYRTAMGMETAFFDAAWRD